MKQGILRIVPTHRPRKPEIGRLARNMDKVINLPQTDDDCEWSMQWFGNRLILSIITEPSESRKPISINETVFDIENNAWMVVTKNLLSKIEYNPHGFERIIVDDGEFNEKTLRMICNREINDGDYVLINEINGTFEVPATTQKAVL